MDRFDGGRLRKRVISPASRRGMSVQQDQGSGGAGRIPTSLVGSYAQPNWLIDREPLKGRFPPRVRATELWRVDPGYLEEAQDDATLLAIGDEERAGLDIITDGEGRRASYSHR